jgi:3-oxoacyl-[acyl-carrier protein] reductase
MALRTDVTSPAEIGRAVEAVLGRWGRIDILVNNAGGFAVLRLSEEIGEDEWQAILASNLTSVFLCSKAVLPVMKRQRYGRIVNLASVVGRGGAVRVTSHYAAAKAGVIGFTRHLALEVGRTASR